MRIDLLVFRLFRLSGGDLFQLLHPIEHGVALHRGALRILQRRKTIRAANQTGEQGRLGKIELGGALSEIRLRGRLDSVTTGAEINPVHVELEDLVFGQLALDAQRDHRFEQLAADGATA